MPLNEGQTVQYTVITTRVADGTVLYWKTTGNTTNSDIVGGNTGSITITNNQATFNVTTSADVDTDGTKTLGIALSTGSVNGPTVTSTASLITVDDTSRAPVYALYVWGSGGTGSLGLNDTISRSSPTQVGTDTIWSSVKTNGNSCFGVKTNGTLWAWGYNASGELGTNDVNWRSSPTQIGSLTNWSSVFSDGGSFSTFAIKNDGTLWAWGDNSDGRLGLNNRINRSSPVQVATDTNWSSIANGGGVVAGLKTNGSLWLIGGFDINSFFTNSQSTRSSPVQVNAGSDWSKISNNYYAMFGIRTNGTLWSWGTGGGAYGFILGRNTTNNPPNSASPAQLGSGTNWSDVYASGDVAVSAVKSDGTAWVWGWNIQGQLGLNTGGAVNYVSSPTQIGSASWANVKVHRTSMGIKTDGTLWTWGENFVGSFGNSTSSSSFRSSPVQVGSNTNWGQVSPSYGGPMVAITSS